MLKLTRLVRRSLGLSLLALPALATLGSPDTAVAQSSEPQLNLEVRNIDLTSTCNDGNFRPELKITNWGTEPYILTRTTVRMFFNNPRPEPIEFVNADWVRIHNPDGSITGFAGAFHFEGPPPDPACVHTPARVANQAHFIAFESTDGQLITVPPNGGYATVIVSLRRDGGQSPFDAGCDDFTKILSQNPSRPFMDDAFFNLVENNPQGPPSVLMCEYVSPNNVDALTGIDPCSNTTGCGG